ncbi:hypothetical protein [Streptomyces sp. G-G2]|uniref:hypothetical protein n=1 Tax=Streptomyces sp. G-G2 TaxID=3046201 RepID=UPI0024BB4297|nr:hypothetical protein [Streptomyces sp. G-G2]MDJ0385926.1 hypothetical protein [Streptomyces sp. G-G2]
MSAVDRVGWFGLPFWAAARVFCPRRPDRVRDAPVQAMQIARTVVGLSATCWLVFAYPLKGRLSDFATARALDAFLSVWVLLGVGFLTLVLFVLASRPPARRMYGKRLLGPLGALLSLPVTVSLAWFFMFREGMWWIGHDWSLLTVLGGAAGLVACTVILAFGFSGLVLALHFGFRTADVHEVLPPFISTILGWAMFIFQLLDRPLVDAPDWVMWLFLVGPALSVTALAFWELHRLRSRFGITLRRALSPAPVGPAHP